MKGNFYENERVALFIDGANLYSAARALGFDIDYRRLLKVFREKGRLVRAYYYTALVEDQEYSPIRPLIDWLDYNGYTMVTKPTKEFTDAMGRRKIKGNMDIELAIDVLEMAEHLDHVILFSGDGDFRRLVEAVQRKGAARLGGQHHQVLAADGGRRAAPPGRRLHRAVGAGAADRAQPVGAPAAAGRRQRRSRRGSRARAPDAVGLAVRGCVAVSRSRRSTVRAAPGSSPSGTSCRANIPTGRTRRCARSATSTRAC